MALCSIGPRHVIAWASSSRKHWIDLVSTTVLEVGADRAAGGGERDRDIDACAAVVNVDRPDHAEVDDALAQLGVDHRAQRLGDLFLGQHGTHSSKRSGKAPTGPEGPAG